MTKAGKSHRPRLLMVGTHLPQAVGSRSVGEGLAERLRALGFTARLVSNRHSRTLRVFDMLLTVWTARASYDLVQLDVYSGQAFLWAELVSRLARMLGKPVVMTLHGGNLPTFAYNHPRRISRLFAHATLITAPSQYLAIELQEFHGSITVIPNPLDLSAYNYERRHNPKPHLIWLRTFHRIYDPSLAIKVLARITSRFPDAHLTMIGPDKDGSIAEVRADAERLGVIDRVTFAGGVSKNEVPRLLSTGDIFLNTTTIDNSPVSVLEAMATGLDVVSTNVGGMTYLIDSEHDGLLVPPGDADAMSEAVMRLLNDPELASRLSANARKRAELHGWDAILPQWEVVLTKAVAEPNRIHA
jgi:glycosyltransferase involved in cell wall biosynthesis